MSVIGRSGTSILREWDQGNSSQRTQLLQWILTRFKSARYSGELESECGSEIALLLPRIVVWMDKTKQQHRKAQDAAAPLEMQLACVQLFLATSNSHKYIREFMQADGLRVLLEILETDMPPHHHGVSTQHRCIIYSVLARIARRGREFKEQISRLGGELSMVRGAIATVDRSVKASVNLQSREWTLCRTTLLEQIVGNRTCAEASYSAVLFMLRYELEVVRIFGAQVLRELISETSFFFDDHFRRANLRALVPLSVELVHSTSIPLLHEGLELVHSLLQKPSTRRPICSLLAKGIHDAAIAADVVDPVYAAMKRTREYDIYIHMRSPFVHAAQSLTTLMHSIPRILPLLVQTHEVLIPLAFVLALERPQSLKWLAALTALHFVFTRCHAIAASHLSQLFMVSVDDLLALSNHVTPEALADELLRDEAHRHKVNLHFFQNGWIRALPPPSSHAVHDGFQGGNENDYASLDDMEYDVEAAVHSVIPAVALHPPYEGEEDEDNDTAGGVMDFAAEKQLIEQLERHFMKFRLFSKAPTKKT